MANIIPSKNLKIGGQLLHMFVFLLLKPHYILDILRVFEGMQSLGECNQTFKEMSNCTSTCSNIRALLRFMWLLLILCTGISPTAGLYAQTPNFSDSPVITISDEYVLNRWTIQDGLPVNSVKQVFQSSDGYIWIVTYGGIARFDGISFTVFNTGTHPELPSHRFQSMTETPDGVLWFEMERRELFLSFSNNQFKVLDETDGLAGNEVQSTHLAGDGSLWIATNSGISVYKNGELKPFKPDVISGRVEWVFADSDSTLFLLHEGYVSRFDGDSLKSLMDEPEQSQSLDRIFKPFMVASDESIYFGVGSKLYRRTDNQTNLVYSTYNNRASIIAIYETEQGEIFFYDNNNGFYRLTANGTPERYRAYSGKVPAEGINYSPVFRKIGSDLWTKQRNRLYKNNTLVLEAPDIIVDFYPDREGSIWLATFLTGLLRLKPKAFQTYSEEEGLSSRNIYPVFESSRGNILAGNLRNGLHRIGPDNSVKNVEVDIQVRAIHELHDGTILLGGEGGYVYEFSNGQVSLWNADTSYTPHGIHALYEDETLRVWVGSGSGLFLYNPSSSGSGWRNLSEELQLPPYPVRYFTPASDGMLWMAIIGGGVVGLQYTNSDRGNYSLHQLGIDAEYVRSIYVETAPSPNLPPDLPEPSAPEASGGDERKSSIVKSAADRESTADGSAYYLWIGTEGHGLFRVLWDPVSRQTVNVSKIRQKDGLPDNTIHQILDDDFGNFWMSTNAGIFRVSAKALHDWCDGKQSVLNGTTFTESDGLRNREANGGMQPAGVRASDGKLWFPTQDGIAVIDPASVRKNTTPPPVHIEHLQTGDDQLISPESVQLERGKRNFEIRYAGLSYLAPDKVTFSYKLEGFDETWVNAGTRRTAYYTNVPPGNYQFVVTASNNDGVPSTEPAVAEIYVSYFFYETVWFRWIMILASISLVVVWVRLRFRRLQKSEARLRRTVDARTAELKNAMTRLAELDRAKSRFFANMSHEFRTPLTLILGPLEELLKKKTDPELHHQHSLMKRNGERLKRLIDQVLDLVKLESGAMKLNLKVFNLQEFLLEMAELFRPLAENQGLELIITPLSGGREGDHSAIARDDFMVAADMDKVEQILANLLSNAIKFTDEGGRIEVGIKDNAGRVIVTVTDTGKGIPPEKMDSVFDRFYQVDDGENRSSEGMGIGLALCRELILLHKGTISVESEPEKGSTFKLEFLKGTEHFRSAGIDLSTVASPVAEKSLSEWLGANEAKQSLYIPRPEMDSTDKKNQDRNGNKSSDKPKYNRDQTTLLIVEDHQDMRDYLKSILMDEYKIQEASNGEEAIATVQKNPPDLIVADIMMPVMDGLTFSRRLRETPLHRNIPIVFLTARSGDDDQIEALQHGGNDYLSKPFNPEVLLARVEALLASQKRLREQLLVEVVAEHSPDKTDAPRKGGWLVDVARHIEKNLHDPGFGIEQLAGLMHTDQSQLYRKVKKKTGRSPVQLLKEARLTKAQKLIEAGETNYSEIAYACGFNSLSYFSRSYKKQFGFAPSDTSSVQNESET